MSREKVFETLLVIVTGLLILHFIIGAKSLVIAATIVAFAGLISKYLSDKIVWVWFKIAEILGNINGKILLTLIFYLFLFPISVLYRIFTKDSLNLKKSKESYYIERNKNYSKEDLSVPW